MALALGMREESASATRNSRAEAAGRYGSSEFAVCHRGSGTRPVPRCSPSAWSASPPQPPPNRRRPDPPHLRARRNRPDPGLDSARRRRHGRPADHPQPALDRPALPDLHHRRLLGAAPDRRTRRLPRLPLKRSDHYNGLAVDIVALDGSRCEAGGPGSPASPAGPSHCRTAPPVRSGGSATTATPATAAATICTSPGTTPRRRAPSSPNGSKCSRSAQRERDHTETPARTADSAHATWWLREVPDRRRSAPHGYGD